MALREIVDIVKRMYGVRVNEEEYTEVETVLPQEGYEGYLQNLVDSKDTEISNIAKTIKIIFDKDTVSKGEKQKFDNSCAEAYKNEAEKSIKEIIGKILRMEL
jgi:hypothetical protein